MPGAQVVTILFSSAYLLQALGILHPIVGCLGFIGEGYSRKLIPVVKVSQVLDIFENRIQRLHPV